MITSKSSEGRIIGFLRQAEAGMPVKEIGRKHGFSDFSFYKWRSKYGDMDANEAKRLRELELENGKLNNLIKYSEKQKLSAIQTYISGELGLRATALLHNVGFTSLRNWISRYEALGIAGVQRKRRQACDVEFKMKVLQRVKAEGLSNRQAGALFNIRRFSSIADWERAYDKDGMGGLIANHIPPAEAEQNYFRQLAFNISNQARETLHNSRSFVRVV